jgi:hypothetical protein
MPAQAAKHCRHGGRTGLKPESPEIIAGDDEVGVLQWRPWVIFYDFAGSKHRQVEKWRNRNQLLIPILEIHLIQIENHP